MKYIGNETVTRVRAPLVTSTRSTSLVRDWTSATRTSFKHCSVQPFLMSNKLVVELEDSREFAQEMYRVWVPEGADFQSTDRVEWRNKTYDVRGPTGFYADLSGNEHHTQFLIVLREG